MKQSGLFLEVATTDQQQPVLTYVVYHSVKNAIERRVTIELLTMPCRVHCTMCNLDVRPSLKLGVDVKISTGYVKPKV